jgi:hypothetical protein
MSSTILSLLVALFAVLSSAVPILMGLTMLGQSNVYCSLFEWKDSKVKLVVANRGTRPAVVKSLQLVGASAPAIFFRSDVKEQILEPNKYQVLSFTCVVNDVENPLPSLDTVKPESTLLLRIFPFASESGEIPCANWESFQ